MEEVLATSEGQEPRRLRIPLRVHVNPSWEGNCGSCHWWHVSDCDKDYGICKASPPVYNSYHSWWMYPKTERLDGCRMWEPIKPTHNNYPRTIEITE